MYCAVWKEFDLESDQPVWSIPRAKMKVKSVHCLMFWLQGMEDGTLTRGDFDKHLSALRSDSPDSLDRSNWGSR
jgi:hypothetical protein